MVKPFTGTVIPPCWHLVPPGRSAAEVGRTIVLNPGPGFGFGDHPSTQLCLQALAAFAPKEPETWSALDFGSGTGILSLAAAHLGATVIGVEIDEAALENSARNLSLNSMDDRIQLVRTLEEASGPFDLIVANMLRPVLRTFARDLVARLAPHGTLILSGLVSTDVPEISVAFMARLGGRKPEVYRREEWWALVWHMRY